VATRQAEIAAGGGADRRSAKNAAKPMDQSREARLISAPEQLDEEFAGWVREAYQVGQGGHLARSPES
jgi:hypothetical protein